MTRIASWVGWCVRCEEFSMRRTAVGEGRYLNYCIRCWHPLDPAYRMVYDAPDRHDVPKNAVC